jgi:hypothetical protein
MMIVKGSVEAVEKSAARASPLPMRPRYSPTTARIATDFTTFLLVT